MVLLSSCSYIKDVLSDPTIKNDLEDIAERSVEHLEEASIDKKDKSIKK